MKFKERIKKFIIKRSIEQKKKNNPFNEQAAENFSLAADAQNNQNNSYYFSCHDAAGVSLLFRLGLRGGGFREIWFAYKDNAGNAYVNIQMLDETGKFPAYTVCLETGAKWEFSFTGKLKAVAVNGNAKNDLPVDASFTGVFTAATPIFEFSHHMDAEPLARALAKEKWEKGFQTELAENHQTHYEQQGNVAGTLCIGGVTQELNLPAMRDHSFGKRDWSYMDRHIWLMALLPNGGALNVNMVRYPAVRGLQTGYYIENKKTTCVYGVSSMDELECTGKVPEVFAYTVTLSDGRNFTVHCKKELEWEFPFDDGAYTIHEGVGSFELEGIRGRGILEFGFNGDSARWTGK